MIRLLYANEVKDSHDRYANIEVSYLLQRMEAYDGVTILATNLHANLDETFTRRLHFIVNFPFPDEEDRRRIWRTLFPDTVACHPNVDLDLLAGRFKLAGGNIRNITMDVSGVLDHVPHLPNGPNLCYSEFHLV